MTIYDVVVNVGCTAIVCVTIAYVLRPIAIMAYKEWLKDHG